MILQNKSMFSILGHCVTHTRGNSLMVGPEEDERKSSNYDNDCAERITSVNGGNFDSRNCGCLKLDGPLEQSRQASIGNSNWILLMFDPREQNEEGIHRLPKLHHIHWNGKIMSEYDVHVCKSWLLHLHLAFLKLLVIVYDLCFHLSHNFISFKQL